MLESLENDWNLLVQDESIFIHDSIMTKRRWIIKEKRPMVTVTGSHEKTIMYGALSLDGKQLFRQDDKFDSQSFISYLEQVKKKFNKFVIFLDRATQHRSKKVVEEYLQQNIETIKVEYFPVGSAFLNAVEECWRQGKCNILSNYYSSFSRVKQAISNFYRKRRFNLDIKKYLFRSTN